LQSNVEVVLIGNNELDTVTLAEPGYVRDTVLCCLADDGLTRAWQLPVHHEVHSTERPVGNQLSPIGEALDGVATRSSFLDKLLEFHFLLDEGLTPCETDMQGPGLQSFSDDVGASKLLSYVLPQLRQDGMLCVAWPTR